jgi:heme-degrading monooxygenase HmoA
MRHSFYKRWGPTLLAILITGCAISTPHSGPGLVKAPGGAPARNVVVVVTNAVLDNDQREGFDKHVSKIHKVLGDQPGLVQHSLRKQPFGNEVWTMTVWVDDEARRRFVESSLHRAAITAGAPALRSVRFARVQVSETELPIAWDRALRMLDAAQQSY